jgi:octopine oxidase subunit B
MITRTGFDAAVIGGGLVGSAIAFGLAGLRERVIVLDEGDLALRASRGNFALVWVQSKGMGLPAYSHWSLRSATGWPAFAEALTRESGVDLAYERPGGFHVTLGEREWLAREAYMARLCAQPGMPELGIEMLDHARLAECVPEIGPEVSGASYCPFDGHCNSLRLFRALHIGMERRGATYLANHAVDCIEPQNEGFRIVGHGGVVEARKVVLAAGLGNARLGPMVGLDVPVRPQRGQIVVTEKTRPFLRYPISTLRQTDEGGLLIGDSQEEAAEPVVGMPVIAVLADRAQRIIPLILDLNVVRAWAALRVMTHDGFPIYDQSTSHPGAFVATCHSGVTLAANHAGVVAAAIARGRLDADFDVFRARRFDVQKAA